MDRVRALAEAARCLLCEAPPCRTGCPARVDPRVFIRKIRGANFAGAARHLRRHNILAGVCAEICASERQCAGACLSEKLSRPIDIAGLQRFVCAWEREAGELAVERITPWRERVAVVGAGPAGLTVAGDLARLGYRVEVFEALHGAGGVLRYGIPNFRLPKTVLDAEIDYVRSLGAQVRPNAVIGRLFTLPSLLESGYDAAFIGTGAGAPHFMGIAGENYNGVYSANEFLTRANLMQAYRVGEVDTPLWVGERVVVVGGGNVAMDSARVALRMGAREVSIVYRRSPTEMPARAEEVEHAKQEGIRFEFLTCPTRIMSDGDFWVGGIECQRMELGEPDESGRCRPLPCVGSEFTISADTVIIAIGTSANPLIQRTTPGLAVDQRGYIVADPETGRTNLPRIYAGGDIVTGSATVIEAMGAGRHAAATIHEELSKRRRRTHAK